GLMQPKQGNISINGELATEDITSYRKQFGYIPEQPILYDELTLYEHLRLTAMAYDIDEHTFEARMPDLLKAFRMERQLHFFSVPNLYIVDEPFVGLDILAINAYIQWMERMKENGAGVLMSTHILATAERYCDRFVILHDGKIRAQGTVPELREQFNMKNAS